MKHPEKIKEFREIDVARKNKELLEEETKMQGPQPEPQLSAQDNFKNILEGDGEEELTEDKVQEMMREWMSNG